MPSPIQTPVCSALRYGLVSCDADNSNLLVVSAIPEMRCQRHVNSTNLALPVSQRIRPTKSLSDTRSMLELNSILLIVVLGLVALTVVAPCVMSR